MTTPTVEEPPHRAARLRTDDETAAVGRAVERRDPDPGLAERRRAVLEHLRRGPS